MSMLLARRKELRLYSPILIKLPFIVPSSSLPIKPQITQALSVYKIKPEFP
jgi:hypothetical protein